MNIKSIVAAVGFVAALASICALAVAILQLAQSINAKSESDKAQSTMFANFATSAAIQATQESNQRIANANLATQAAIQDQQLGVQKEIATAQVQGPKSTAPTATAIAQTVIELAKTNDALEAQRRILQLTQTTIARPTETPTSTKVPPTLQPTFTTPPRVVPASPIATILSVSRPSHINIVIGGNYSIPPGNWTWVCTGDFSITLTDGTKKALYDVGISNTGLTMILQPNSSFTLDGPFDMNQGVAVGDCYPYSQSEKDSAISEAISAQLNQGCGSKCQYVNIIELDKDGKEVSNYWTPPRP